MRERKKHLGSLLALSLFVSSPGAGQVVMFGGGPSRNMVSDEKGLPTKWNPATGENVKWVVPLGSQSYGGPIVADGKVFVGTNNGGQRNPKLTGDRGVLIAFNAADGRFLWQATYPKLAA